MKLIQIASFLATLTFSIIAFAAGPGGGGGGTPPGGGGNQPDAPGGGGGGGSFIYDTFLTDSTTSGGCIIYDALMTSYVAGETTITIPAEVTTIAEGALAGNESATVIDATAATGITAIPEAFAAGCNSLLEVALPSETTVIGASSFTMDASLADFMGTGVATIGDYAFFGCKSLVLSDSQVYSPIGAAALEGVSFVDSEDGDVYPSGAAPLVAWLKDGGTVASSLSAPGSYATENLRLWLTNDVANLEAYLYAEDLATNAYFTALSVSGTNFLFTAQDVTTLFVARASLQVSTDLNTWSTVAEDDIVDGVYTIPSATNAFARIVYTLFW